MNDDVVLPGVGEFLLPAESMAVTVAARYANGGEPLPENVTAMCALALLRLLGKYDWTRGSADER
jgi:hypothetical protein